MRDRPGFHSLGRQHRHLQNLGVATHDLKLADGHAHLLSDKNDPVAGLGRFEGNPIWMKGMDVMWTGEANVPEGHLSESTGHSSDEYLKPGSTSQYNMSAVITGQSGKRVQGANIGPEDLLTWPPFQ